MPEITMPKLSDTMTEGTLIAWKKKKGDKVSTGDVIAEIETDKATMEWESPEDGVLTEIFVEEGGKVEVGERIAIIGEAGEIAAEPKVKAEAPAPKEKPTPGEDVDEETAPDQTMESTQRPAPSKAPAPPKQPTSGAKVSDEEARVKASPLARRLAGEQGVDLGQLQGTGPGGRVTESDVRAAGKSKASQPVAAKTQVSVKPGPGTRTNLSGSQRHRGAVGAQQEHGSAFLSQYRDRRGAVDDSACGAEIGG